MKYYLKDKNGTVHTESQNSFKMAFKHHHKKDDTTADGYYTHVYITGFHFKNPSNPAQYFSLGTWSLGVPAIHRKLYGETWVQWDMCSNSYFITNQNLMFGTQDIFKNRDVSNDIIIRYNTNSDKIPSGYELMFSQYGVQNHLLNWYNIVQTNYNKNINKLLVLKEDEGQEWTWGYGDNEQANGLVSHSVYNKSNKTYIENEITLNSGGEYNYFTIKKSDWSGKSKIRIRVKMLVNAMETGSQNISAEDQLGNLGDTYTFSSPKYKPIHIVARTSDNEQITESDFDSVSMGLMFLNGDSKGDTFTSVDTTKTNKAERTRGDSCKDYLNYEPLTPTSNYYTYSYKPYDNPYIITKEEMLNYINDPNPRFNLMIQSDVTQQIGETSVTLTHDTDIKNLDSTFKNATGCNDWFERAVDETFGDDFFPYRVPETSYYNYCDSYAVECYYDIDISKVKNYLHIFFPFVTTHGNNGYTYVVISNLEMSVEGVN